MTVFRSIRIEMADRPGALSAIGASLAANRVDIVRLDVVSHEDGTVVDDLYLAAETDGDVDRAVRSFYGDTRVLSFVGLTSDPVTAMGESLGRIAAASSIGEAFVATVEGASRFLAADGSALLRVNATGGYDVLVGPAGLPAVEAGSHFAPGWSLSTGQAMAFPARDGWAPPAFAAALSAHWVAAAPCGAGGLLIVSRTAEMPFYRGEIARLDVFARAAGTMTLGKGAPVAAPESMPAGQPPAGAVTLAA